MNSMGIQINQFVTEYLGWHCNCINKYVMSNLTYLKEEITKGPNIRRKVMNEVIIGQWGYTEFN